MLEKGLAQTNVGRRRSRTVGDVAVIVAGLLVLSGPRFVVADDLARQLLVMITIVVVARLRWRSQLAVRGGNAFVLLILFGLYGAASSLWSSDTLVTISSALLTLLAVIFGSLAGRGVDITTVISSVMVLGLLVGTISLVLAVVDPTYALVSDVYQEGALQGIYTHRNHLAYVVAMASVAAIVRLFFTEARKLVTLAALVVLAYVLVRAASATAVVLVSVSLAFVVLLKVLLQFHARYRGPLLLVVMSVLVVLAGYVASLSSEILSFLGRDETLTGRTDIWRPVLSEWMQNPVFGTGWGAAWTESSEVQQRISDELGFQVAHAHNGYLDVLLQLGVLGLALLVAAYLATVVPAARSVVYGVIVSPIAVSAVVFVTVILGYSLAEPRIAQSVAFAMVAVVGGAQMRGGLNEHIVLGVSSSLKGRSDVTGLRRAG